MLALWLVYVITVFYRARRIVPIVASMLVAAAWNCYTVRARVGIHKCRLSICRRIGGTHCLRFLRRTH